MSNIYWPVYLNLEKSVDELAFAIHIDDEQMDVYSTRIMDLIIRAAAEMESLSKELYRANGGTKDSAVIKYDDDAIKLLNNRWQLEHKKVIISSAHCFQSNRVLTPFVKNEIRTASSNGKLTYSWNNAYQNLKHDRGNSMKFGSVRYLFDILAALFVLNIYHRDEVIKLGKDQEGVAFPLNMGSSLFSVEINAGPSYDGEGVYKKKANFDSSIYYVDRTPESAKGFQDSIDAFNSVLAIAIRNHPKMINYLATHDVSNYDGNLSWDVLGQEEMKRILGQNVSKSTIDLGKLEYVALLNKNSV
ncbi:MAG: hypothetical protein V4448_02095 [Pseudomonadota bacterium]